MKTKILNVMILAFFCLDARAIDVCKKSSKDCSVYSESNSEDGAEVMTPEYQQQYANDMKNYKSAGLSDFNPRDQDDFAGELPVSERDKFNARHNVRTEFGANNEFTGNGLTQSRENSSAYGMVEALTLENNPPSIQQMKNVKTINLVSRDRA